MRKSDAIRADVLTRLGKTAAAQFAAAPELASVMMLVAQFWCDEAEDQCHVRFLGSTRDVPLWPNLDSQDGDAIALPGEVEVDGPPIDERALVLGFEPFCPEGGSQEEHDCYNYRPYAIARRDGSVEVVGRVYRPWATVYHDDDDDDGDDDDDAPEIPAIEGGGEAPLAAAIVDDARLAALLDGRGDDDTYRVIADYLQERGDPRGDLVALALTDPGAYRTRLAVHHRAWLGALATSVSAARFDRGLLAEIELFVQLDDAASDSPLWGTIEAAVLQDDDLLAGVLARPRALGHLQLRTTPDALALLARTTALPKLRSLTLRRGGDTVAHADALAQLAAAPWRAGLRGVGVCEPRPAALADWHARFPALGVERLHVATGTEDTYDWRFTFHRSGRIDVAQASWEPSAALNDLVQILDAWTDRPPVTVVASRFWDPDAAIRRTIADWGGNIQAP